MALTLNGTTGIQNVLGSAAAPAESNTTNSNTGVYFPTSTTLGFSTAGTNAVTIDASQNVGIGQSTPTVKLDVNGATNFGGASGVRCGIGTAFVGGQAEVYSQGAVPLGIGTASTQQLRFYTNSTLVQTIYTTSNVSILGGLWLGNSADPGSTIKFAGTVISNGAGTQPLKWNSTSGVVTYDTSSRLVKENIVDSSYGLAEILQLKSRKYFRTDDQRNEIGLIADEVQTVLPEFVPMVSKSLFTKNEADTELIAGGVNYDKLTSVLVKAIQEQQALITQLTDRIAALEAK